MFERVFDSSVRLRSLPAAVDEVFLRLVDVRLLMVDFEPRSLPPESASTSLCIDEEFDSGGVG